MSNTQKIRIPLKSLLTPLLDVLRGFQGQGKRYTKKHPTVLYGNLYIIIYYPKSFSLWLVVRNLGISHSSQNLRAGWLRKVHSVHGHCSWLLLVNTVEELRMGIRFFEGGAGVLLVDLGVVGMLLLIVVVVVATSPNVNKLSIIGRPIHYSTFSCGERKKTKLNNTYH